MPFAANGAVRLFFETIGPADAPPVLLLNGAGKQAIDAHDGFCALLVARGFRVVRYDQRDTGRSTGFPAAGADASGVAAAIAAGRTPKLVYDAGDLAADAVAVLDAAGIERAHLFARSLGAYVAQVVALRHPERVASLTLAMAFSRSIGATVTPERLHALDSEHFASVDDFIARSLATARAVGNPAYFDAALLTAGAAAAWARGVHPGAAARHFAVGLAAADLRPALAALRLPVEVIGGALDRVVPAALAAETAVAISRATLTMLADMAHEGPPPLWPRWVEKFAASAARAI